MKTFSCKNGLSVKKFCKRYLIIPLLCLVFLFTIFTKHAIAQDNLHKCLIPEKDGISTIENGRIESIARDQSSLQVQCDSVLKIISVNQKLTSTLQGFSSGDFVNLSYTAENELTSISVVKSVIDGFLIFGIFIVTGIGLYLITFLIVLSISKNKKESNLNNIFVGLDNRLSNSKSQMAIWFFVLLVSYISLSILRVTNFGLGFVGGIGIPQNLLLLSGLSALTYGAAKVITQSQVNSNPDSKLEADPNKAGLQNEVGLQNFVTDDDGRTDFGDLQMSFITLLAVVAYLLQLFNFLGVLELHRLVTLPDVDTTILSIFGLSQGAYLAKKAVVATAKV